MQISVVIPLLNEAESLRLLYDRIAQSLKEYSYEVIFIDDGSTDSSWSTIEALAALNKEIKAFSFRRNYGKSQALQIGFKAAKGDVIITLDADLQDQPEEIPKLYKVLTEGNYDLVCGWKKKRYDPVLTKNIPSKLFNYVAQKTSRLKLHDFNCGLKAYKKEAVKNITLYGDMHRYIPVLVKNAGFNRITEVVTTHKSRRFGVSKFGSSRFINGFLDLATLSFIGFFGRKPMHFFGAVGSFMFTIGFFASIYIGLLKLLRLYNKEKTILIVDNPWFYIALTCMIIGVQLFLAGFIGELLIRQKQNSDTESESNLIQRKIGF